MSKELYIGVMSGTSLDGIDIALCEVNSATCRLVSSLEYPFEKKLKNQILKVIDEPTTLEQIGRLDNQLGNLFASAINAFLLQNNIDASNVRAIGLHGQTLWHNPDKNFAFSMQLGDANIVHVQTGIKVVADFRGMDMANGGQGAPFAPAFHQFLFNSLEKDRAVLNLGGMANITILGENLRGWDTGCGNVLLDMWASIHTGESYDKDGKFAMSGELNHELLRAMLNDDYFKKLPPKSTGREYFNQKFIAQYLMRFQSIKNEDIQRTLLELTAMSIADDLKKTDTKLLIVCGGGVKNIFLMQRLKELCGIEVVRSDTLGVSSDFMEAMLFAWLAYKRVHRQKVLLSCVTGAKEDSILGGVYG
ncbi:MAG: anhydro-N-acetylmuramic acid kinase [Campylobacterota bacterium]|nr:anhydro-N-acetylmuramic acid kinase [Campylobacterota bacterium]